MTRRERTLALCVGSLVVIAALLYGGRRVAGVLTVRQDRIVELNDEVNRKEVLVQKGRAAERLLKTYRERSLASDPHLASTRYRAWLFNWCEKAGIARPNIEERAKRPVRVAKGLAHVENSFAVTCEATLPQLVNLLYGFYSQDYLHRIKSLHASPSSDNRLSLTFEIDAIGMPDVDDHELVDLPSQRLALNDLDDYHHVIVRRNPYAPANLPPKFPSGQAQRGFVNQRMSFTPKVDDPEKGNLKYRVEHDGLEGLSIDENSGKLEWTPTETGDFEVLVYATDDGVPAKEASQTIRLAVSNPPDPPPTVERRTFDEAKYTYVTGIVEVNGRRQVWLTVRTEGKWLRLYEGDTFQIGSLDGKIVRIFPRYVEILAGQDLRLVRFGQSLHDGEIISQAENGVASADK